MAGIFCRSMNLQTDVFDTRRYSATCGMSVRQEDNGTWTLQFWFRDYDGVMCWRYPPIAAPLHPGKRTWEALALSGARGIPRRAAATRPAASYRSGPPPQQPQKLLEGKWKSARIQSSSMLGACAHNIGSLLKMELYHKQHVNVLFIRKSSKR